jgi:hypothetical protein
VSFAPSRYGTRLYRACEMVVHPDPPADPAEHPPAGESPRCSARGCRAAAGLELHWRNPALHDATRVKIWLACPDHAESLSDFLRRRGFLLGQVPMGESPT